MFPSTDNWLGMKLHLSNTLIQPNCPFWQLAELFADQPCGFLLDSGMDPEKLGRFSFVGGRPTALLQAKRLSPSHDRLFQISCQRWRTAHGKSVPAGPGQIQQWQGDPLEALRMLQQEYGLREANAEISPFSGGLVGYLGYETAHAIEDIPDEGIDDLNLPDLSFMVADEVIVHDHTTGETRLLITGRGLTDNEARAEAHKRSLELEKLITEFRFSAPEPEPEKATTPIRAHFTRESYMQAVDQCRQHILAGDIFEICLTHRLETDLNTRPWQLYKLLRGITPAPFASFLNFPDFQVVSASPERFLKLDKDRLVESRPIKGTRPRGDNPWDDQRLRDELQNSEKDRSENVMIVDLVRNDIGKVAEIGSIQVPELLVVEPYATVFQLVSTITGQLRQEKDAFDLVGACFPGGSMTGAPKIEAMKIIDAIEPVKRGIYSGAIGYFDRSGTLDLSIVIRTIVCKDGVATFGVGGAVVADSDPAEEYQETLDKARALIKSLGGQL